MATNIVPKFETPLPPKRFFTADKKDYTTIMNWLGGNKLEYETFYASFLNHTIITARSAVDPKKKGSLTQKDNALIWIFDDVPVQTQGFLDAMSAYGEDHWDRGITYGMQPFPYFTSVCYRRQLHALSGAPCLSLRCLLTLPPCDYRHHRSRRRT